MPMMRIINQLKYCVIIILVCLIAIPALAKTQLDSDNDGVQDKDEVEIYHTNPLNPDTDGDGYNDWLELNNGYSPLSSKKVKLKDNDYDSDGLSDRMELNFHTDLTNPDTDNDGHKDGEEINNGYDPLKAGNVKLSKKIEINTGKEQKLYYFLNNVRMGEFKISSGKLSMQTPRGNFKIDGKALRAWSKYGLWMPYWMSLKNGYFGIHELPEWPNRTKEGENHLGIPVSHGCVRLGVGPAEFLYNWAPVGTPVKIY
ncbi:L,D-transpeptidase [Patescibacteria group bacterium]|nr:L,D-transpeptidase [Patescibacteria group bacterium]MBU1663650.1 L,D-transpeptidase [Patescibacteria group bacterium]MBU1934219.1 L,D-transpeptidase [Patescibacteria group bacterium]MBU2007942.1 L,D-transpeptidase [Patescibacteria group bacterium]MBU2233285.1 L,D-transpeptidase [Patescibacteria group bacterium]